jgi:hypothetical protein
MPPDITAFLSSATVQHQGRPIEVAQVVLDGSTQTVAAKRSLCEFFGLTMPTLNKYATLAGVVWMSCPGAARSKFCTMAHLTALAQLVKSKGSRDSSEPVPATVVVTLPQSGVTVGAIEHAGRPLVRMHDMATALQVNYHTLHSRLKRAGLLEQGRSWSYGRGRPCLVWPLDVADKMLASAIAAGRIVVPTQALATPDAGAETLASAA